MTDTVSWRPVSLTAREQWRSIFNRSHEVLNVTGLCPICGGATLHRWYQSDQPAARTFRGERFVAQGRLWEWCSSCHSYEYYPDGFVPAWWSAPFEVDQGQLTRVPDAIELARGRQRDAC